MSKIWKFDGLLLNEGWMCPCYVTTNEQGIIEEIADKNTSSSAVIEVVSGYAIPGFQNAHSHAFQYAMSGLAEIHPDPTSADDFWSWRETMYNIALSMDPDQFEHIATMLYAEMLSHGYTHVAEFHYVHHNKDGLRYDHLAEMGTRLIAAAQTAGIGITLIPIFYQKGGFGQAPGFKQKRFISATAKDYLELLSASEEATKNYSRSNVGIGIHSLRAVDQYAIQATLAETKRLPIHIHIAEQLKEVEDCLAHYQQRPVEWLLNTFDVHSHFHLVHATHLNKKEISGIAQSGAHVVLCPSTEGNLGDGIFPLSTFQQQGGQWSIGTDSHIGLNPLEELRMLDYGQRLTTHRRNQFVSYANGDSGLFGLDMAWKAGRKAMGNQEEAYFAIGQSFDAVVIDSQTPHIATSSPQHILATLIYSGDRSSFKGTLVRGIWKAKDGKHVSFDSILSQYKKTIAKLKIR
ncbi:formimidoylglutamate deiminase [Reichenbachiella carrageenanivorans]|uniref:Formimidoylglutamate deiminase n=1 Tax=Reichenbachiella carrageenanivorans TaxID=2979869 RepID=A0ABY6D2N5_9BACT|nr:formimidoylglutamate deiminase [Reichenbachiella carrageenanivorans]UXX80014.1 formimidoylglutamate deiminase [Reichenbachiella carrageenanivorans]